MPGVVEVRGAGLMIGIELDSPTRAERIVRAARETGWLLIQEGDDGRVLALTPALTIPEPLLDGAARRLVELLSA